MISELMPKEHSFKIILAVLCLAMQMFAWIGLFPLQKFEATDSLLSLVVLSSQVQFGYTFRRSEIKVFIAVLIYGAGTMLGLVCKWLFERGAHMHQQGFAVEQVLPYILAMSGLALLGYALGEWKWKCSSGERSLLKKFRSKKN